VALLTWPVTSTAPGTGLDPSWMMGLAKAAHDKIHWGSDIAFTYGPLGYLQLPHPYFPKSQALSLVYFGVLQALLGGTAVWLLRRTFSLPVAFVLAVVVCLIVQFQVNLVLGAVWSIEMLRTRAHPMLVRWYAPIAGAFCGVEALVKVNSGATLLAMCTLAVVAGRRGSWRPPLLFAASFAAALLALWLAASQSVGDISEYILNGISIASGYSEAMGVELQNEVAWRYWVAGGAFAAAAAAAWSSTREMVAARRIAVLGVFALVSFSMFKQGFVRHIGIPFVVPLLFVSLAFVSTRRVRADALLTLAVLFVASVAIIGGNPTSYLNPVTRVEGGFEVMRTMASASRRARERARTSEAILDAKPIDAHLLRQVAGRTVHVDPYETDVVYAYGLRWRPLPVFQSYTAYTTRLDELNARAIQGNDAPERILRELTAIDGRHQSFEAPAAMRAMLCRYRQVGAINGWQVLARGGYRCGSTSRLSTVRAAPGERVRIPRPSRSDRLVLVRIYGVAPRGLDAVRTLLLRAVSRYIHLDNGRHRLVPGTARDGLVLSVPPNADYPAPWNIAANPTTLTVTSEPGGIPGNATITYEFEEMPIRAPGTEPPAA
jgi:hypothetical protein